MTFSHKTFHFSKIFFETDSQFLKTFELFSKIMYCNASNRLYIQIIFMNNFNYFRESSIVSRKCNDQVKNCIYPFIIFIQQTFQDMFDQIAGFCGDNLDLSGFMVEESTELSFQQSSQEQKPMILHDGKLSACSYIGRRNSNLDRFSYIITSEYQLYGLYDGHGDECVSTFLQSNVLQKIVHHPMFSCSPKFAIYQVLQQVEQDVCNKFISGSTALIVLVTDSQITIANIGDAMVLGTTTTGESIRLNDIHNFQNACEMRRISEKGGYVIKRGKQYRLNGQINLTRSIGDAKHKQHLSFEPQFKQYPRKMFTKIALVTDGLWNLNSSSISHENTVAIINDLLAGYEYNFQDNATFLNINLN